VLTQLLYACAKVGQAPRGLVPLFEQTITPHMTLTSTTPLMLALLSYSILALKATTSSAFRDALAREGSRTMSQLPPQHLLCMAWTVCSIAPGSSCKQNAAVAEFAAGLAGRMALDLASFHPKEACLLCGSLTR
jgi:hypothetical protein